MSTSVPQSEHLPTAARPDESVPGAPRSGCLLRSVVILATLAIVALPLLIYEFPREIARWHAAAAMEAYLDGDLNKALGSLDQAVAWDPQSPDHFRQRAEWKLEAKDLEGSLADANRAVELDPADRLSLTQRSLVYQHLQRHREAIDDWHAIVDLSERTRGNSRRSPGDRELADPYNGRAYARALAGLEVEAGLKDVERAIKSYGSHPAYLDTRGYLYYRQGRFEAARADLDSAVNGIEALFSSWPEYVEREKSNAADLRELQLGYKSLRYNVAVIRYHRALVLRKLDLPKLAEEDLKRVRQMGFEPTDQLF